MSFTSLSSSSSSRDLKDRYYDAAQKAVEARLAIAVDDSLIRELRKSVRDAVDTVGIEALSSDRGLGLLMAYVARRLLAISENCLADAQTFAHMASGLGVTTTFQISHSFVSDPDRFEGPVPLPDSGNGSSGGVILRPPVASAAASSAASAPSLSRQSLPDIIKNVDSKDFTFLSGLLGRALAENDEDSFSILKTKLLEGSSFVNQASFASLVLALRNTAKTCVRYHRIHDAIDFLNAALAVQRKFCRSSSVQQNILTELTQLEHRVASDAPASVVSDAPASSDTCDKYSPDQSRARRVRKPRGYDLKFPSLDHALAAIDQLDIGTLKDCIEWALVDGNFEALSAFHASLLQHEPSATNIRKLIAILIGVAVLFREHGKNDLALQCYQRVFVLQKNPLAEADDGHRMEATIRNIQRLGGTVDGGAR